MFQQSMMDDHKDAIEQFELSHTLKSNFYSGVERTRLHLQWWQQHIVVIFIEWFESK